MVKNPLRARMAIGATALLQAASLVFAQNNVGPVVVIDTDRTKATSESALALSQSAKALFAEPVIVVSYRSFTSVLMKKLKPKAILLSGQGTPWWEYTSKELEPVSTSLMEATSPILGICGGHQLLAKVFGGTVAPIKRIRPGSGYEGLHRERGYVHVVFARSVPELGIQAGKHEFWQNHVEEVKVLPKGFVGLARSKNVTYEAMRHVTKPIFGVQFHPEKLDGSNHSSGRVLLAFARFAGIRTKKIVRG